MSLCGTKICSLPIFQLTQTSIACVYARIRYSLLLSYFQYCSVKAGFISRVGIHNGSISRIVILVYVNSFFFNLKNNNLFFLK